MEVLPEWPGEVSLSKSLGESEGSAQEVSGGRTGLVKGMGEGPVTVTWPSSWTKLTGPLAVNVPSVDVCGTLLQALGKQRQTRGSFGSHRYSSSAVENFVVEREKEMSSKRVGEEYV